MHATATKRGGAAELSEDMTHGELSPPPTIATLPLSQIQLILNFQRDWEIFFSHTLRSSTSPLIENLARKPGCRREAQAAAIVSDWIHAGATSGHGSKQAVGIRDGQRGASSI